MPDETTQTPAPVAAPATDSAAPSTVTEPAAPAAPILPEPLAVGDVVSDAPDSEPAIDVTDTAADYDYAAVNGDDGTEPPPPETHHVIEIAHGSVRLQNAEYLSGPKQTGNAWLPGAVLRVDVATAESLYKTRVAKRVAPKSQ